MRQRLLCTGLLWLVSVAAAVFAISVADIRRKLPPRSEVPMEWYLMENDVLRAFVGRGATLLVPGGSLQIRVFAHKARITVLQGDAQIALTERSVPDVVGSAPVLSPEIEMEVKIPDSLDHTDGNVKIKVNWEKSTFSDTGKRGYVDRPFRKSTVIYYYARENTLSGNGALEFPFFPAEKEREIQERRALVRTMCHAATSRMVIAIGILAVVYVVLICLSGRERLGLHIVLVPITGAVLSTCFLGSGAGRVTLVGAIVIGVPIGVLLFAGLLGIALELSTALRKGPASRTTATGPD